MWRMSNGASRRGNQMPFGSVYGNPYGYGYAPRSGMSRAASAQAQAQAQAAAQAQARAQAQAQAQAQAKAAAQAKAKAQAQAQAQQRANAYAVERAALERAAREKAAREAALHEAQQRAKAVQQAQAKAAQAQTAQQATAKAQAAQQAQAKAAKAKATAKAQAAQQAQAKAQTPTRTGNPFNTAHNAKVGTVSPTFGNDKQQRDGADVSKAKENKKADEALKDQAAQDQANGETAASAADDGAQAQEKSPEDLIIEEAEAVIEDAAAVEVATDEALEAAKKEAADWQDRYMRLHAEWDTYRRRTNEQRAEEKARATEKLMEDLLPVLDDFERTVDYATENGENGLLEGVKAVQSKLIDALVKDGLQVLSPVGQAYNALEAQAVATVPDTEAFDETVKDVYQKGYKMGNKVIRPAMVTVTTGGPARPKDEEPEDEE